MQDAQKNTIKPGQKLRRVIDTSGAQVGHEYTVISRKWDESDEIESLVADGGYIKELLKPENSGEFEVV